MTQAALTLWMAVDSGHPSHLREKGVHDASSIDSLDGGGHPFLQKAPASLMPCCSNENFSQFFCEGFCIAASGTQVIAELIVILSFKVQTKKYQL